mgnify:CR=1 FL=1
MNQILQTKLENSKNFDRNNNKNKNKITGTNCKYYKNVSYFLQLYVII